MGSPDRLIPGVAAGDLFAPTVDMFASPQVQSTPFVCGSVPEATKLVAEASPILRITELHTPAIGGGTGLFEELSPRLRTAAQGGRA